MRSNRTRSIPVTELYVSSINAQPVMVEGWDRDDLDEEKWNYWEAARFNPCRVPAKGVPVIMVVQGNHIAAAEDENGKVVVIGDGPDDNQESYIEDNADEHGDPIEGSLSETTLMRIENLDIEILQEEVGVSGPQMNYWYPIDVICDESEAIEAALAIRDLSLCVVEVDGVYGLALTGGGMDMSWDICAAYVAVGCLPPIHFSDLPKMAGESGDEYIRKAMVHALDVSIAQAIRQRARLIENFPAFTT